ncbi:MAG TPA: hypothetical protein VH395_09680 [Jatrophihabitantaceae bacterium]|jgi:hypothetical protein
MSTVIMQRFDGLTPDQYDQLRELVRWDRDAPAGMAYHVASYQEDVLRMTDVWDSEEQFDDFVRTRIVPGLQELGIDGFPESIVTAVHDEYNRAANSSA